MNDTELNWSCHKCYFPRVKYECQNILRFVYFHSSDVLFIAAALLAGASLLEIPAVVTPRLYGEPSTRYGDAHPGAVNLMPFKSSWHFSASYPVGFPSGSVSLGSGLFVDANGVRVPGLSYTGGALFLRCALSLVQE